MDKLAKYRQLVKNILSEYTQYKPTCNDLEIQAIFDQDLIIISEVNSLMSWMILLAKLFIKI